MTYTIAIVVGAFNKKITDPMKEKAMQYIQEKGNLGPVIEVPGAFDIPLAVKKLLNSKDVDAVVTLGAIIEGETDHDGVIGYTIAKTLHELSLQYNKPVTLGISGPKITRQQAIDRIESYAQRSVDAAFSLLETI